MNILPANDAFLGIYGTSRRRWGKPDSKLSVVLLPQEDGSYILRAVEVTDTNLGPAKQIQTRKEVRAASESEIGLKVLELVCDRNEGTFFLFLLRHPQGTETHCREWVLICPFTLEPLKVDGQEITERFLLIN